MSSHRPVLDSRFEDVYFPDEPEYVSGALPDTPFRGLCGADYESVVEIMTESQLREAAEHQDEFGGGEDFITRIFEQEISSCVGKAAAQGMECTLAKTYGKENVVHLSAMSLYKQIGVSEDSGATVSDGLRALQNVGILPLNNAENKAKFDATMPDTGFYERYPDNWKETAKRFRIDEANPIRSVGGILTALAWHNPVLAGREGHAICYVRLVWHNGQWKVIYVNSWGQWGFALADFDYGFGTDTIRQIEKSANWAYAIRSVVSN